MAVLNITKEGFKKEVLEHSGLVLVDFYADWCGPCRATGPVIEELSNEMAETKFVKVNVDKEPELASTYSVFSIPTFVVFKDGQVLNQFSGALPKERFIEEIKNPPVK